MAALGPKMLNTANRGLFWVPVIADITKPTAAEINVGVNLTCRVTVANYQFGVTSNSVISDPAACDKIESDVPGRAKVEARFDMFRFKETADDLAWTTFDGANIFGHLVERVGQILETESQETAPVKATDVVTVASVLTHDQIPLAPSTEGYEKFGQPFSVQSFNARSVVTGI